MGGVRSRSWTRLRFGAADTRHQAGAAGVVAGIGATATAWACQLGGEVVFDACYQGNPLVNAGAIV